MCDQQEKEPLQSHASTESAASAASQERIVDVALEEIVAGLVEFYLKVAEARDDAHVLINNTFDRIEQARKRLEGRVAWVAQSVPYRRS